MNKFISQIDTKLKETDYQPIIVSQKKKGIVVTNETFTKNMWEKVLKEAEASDIRAIVFKYKPSKGVFPRSVALVGTFDNWKKKSPLKYDQFSREWKITIGLNIGEYYYKFVVDDDWVCNDDDPKDTDMYGNLNNIIRVE